MIPAIPDELSRFDFLIGRWRCDARILGPDGAWQTFAGSWVGRYIVDGYAIADEYRMTGPDGALVVLGVNIRAYDPARQVWNIKWLNALGGNWIDLGPEALGGVIFEDGAITYAFQEPVAGHAFTRATYTNITKSHFTWRGEMSEDGIGWQAFMEVEVDRIEE